MELALDKLDWDERPQATIRLEGRRLDIVRSPSAEDLYDIWVYTGSGLARYCFDVEPIMAQALIYAFAMDKVGGRDGTGA
jgi:hypothetical protein